MRHNWVRHDPQEDRSYSHSCACTFQSQRTRLLVSLLKYKRHSCDTPYMDSLQNRLSGKYRTHKSTFFLIDELSSKMNTDWKSIIFTVYPTVIRIT